MGARRLTVGSSLGFTLIELMVALAVLVILATVAAPAMGDYVLRARLRAAADDMANQFAIARAQALRLDRDVRMQVIATSTTDWCSGGRQYTLPGGSTEGITLVADGADACDCSDAVDVLNCTIAANTSLVKSTDYPGVELTVGDGTDFTINRKLGVLEDLTLVPVITLRSERKPTLYSLEVQVSPMGNARICVPAGFFGFGGYQPC